MLSLFPSLLSWNQLSPLIIRVVLGVVMFYWGYKGLRDKSTSGTKKLGNAGEAIIGILLVIGLWTQAAAGIAAIGLIVCIVGKIKSKAFLTDGVNYTLLLLVLALSLLVTGAGAFSFDLPL